MLEDILLDGLFAAIAAIGFSVVSRPPRSALPICALIAAVGHSLRFYLMNAEWIGMHIVVATLLSAFVIGIFAVIVSPVVRMPAETCLFPALLPMIPGIYAYRSFGGMAMCLLGNGEEAFEHYFYLFASNGVTCLFILLAMVTGATVPIFMLKKVSFQATR